MGAFWSHGLAAPEIFRPGRLRGVAVLPGCSSNPAVCSLCGRRFQDAAGLSVGVEAGEAWRTAFRAAAAAGAPRGAAPRAHVARLPPAQMFTIY